MRSLSQSQSGERGRAFPGGLAKVRCARRQGLPTFPITLLNRPALEHRLGPRALEAVDSVARRRNRSRRADGTRSCTRTATRMVCRASRAHGTTIDCMKPIPIEQQRSLVSWLMKASGGSYTLEVRRKQFISGPQWAAAYDGSALFHAPTRPPLGFEEVIRHYGEIGIGRWCTHDTDIIRVDALGTPQQAEILAGMQAALNKYGVRCSMVTAETFHHAVWAAGPAAESPHVREY